jgi:Peptidase MA superfamily
MRRMVVLIVLLWACFVVPSVNAASPDFGTPTIEGSFGNDLVAVQPVTLDAAPDRVEVLVTTAEGAPPLVAEVPAPSRAGFRRFEYTIASADGPFLPNTPVVVRWRITTDGAPSLSPEVRTVIKDDRFEWQAVGGNIVRVHWYEGDRAFGERALQIGERAVQEAAAILGVTEEKPVDFFIYADQDPFYDALGPGTRENVGGQANADIRTLFALIPPSSIDDPWVENVVPHELVHLVFDTAVSNPYHFPPRWLNEGLAVYLSVGYSADDRSAVERAARNGDLIPLDGLAGQFPTSADKFGLAYSESVSSVDFFVRTHGRDALIQLIRSYAGGRTDDEAFTAAIGMDVGAFNDAWMADLGAVEPKRYGPQPAPTGQAPTTTVPPTEPAGPVATARTWLLVAILAAVLIASAVLFLRARVRRTARRPIVPGP